MSPHGTHSRYVRGCRCDECRSANTAYMRRRNAERHAYVAKHGLPNDIDHGLTAYSNWGCRCATCCAAQAEKNRAYRLSHSTRITERAAERAAERYAYVADHGLPETIEHGYYAYCHWGCRCELCRTAGSEKNRAAYLRRTQSTRKDAA